MKQEGTKRFEKVGASDNNISQEANTPKDNNPTKQKSMRPISGVNRSITQKRQSQGSSIISPNSGQKIALVQRSTFKEDNTSIVEHKSKLTNPASDIESSNAQSRHKREQDELLADSDDNELVKLGVDMS